MSNEAATEVVTHTPGPWEIRSRHESNMDHTTVVRSLAIPGHDYVVVSRLVDPTPEQDQLARANVRLIAAAPDLLEVVRDLTLYSGGMEYDDWRALVQRAEDAMSKVEGRS